jgi:hypothetical protein
LVARGGRRGCSKVTILPPGLSPTIRYCLVRESKPRRRTTLASRLFSICWIALAICLVVSPAARARSQADMISPACLVLDFPYPLFDDACVANLKRLLCAALAARKWFSEHGPPWAPPLPLSSAEREALEHGGRLHLVSHYAGSLRVLDWITKQTHRSPTTPADSWPTSTRRIISATTPSCCRNSRRGDGYRKPRRRGCWLSSPEAPLHGSRTKPETFSTRQNR